MKFILTSILFLIISCNPVNTGDIQKIDKKGLKARAVGKEVQLLDVRTPKEYNAGHIDNAINFDVKDSLTFLQQIKTLNKNQPVYVYCKMGGRSAKASEILKERGFVTIFDYSGGYSDWILN